MSTIICIAFSCCVKKITNTNNIDEEFYIDTTVIPGNIILSNNPNLKSDNGIFYLHNKPFSGYIKERYPNGSLYSMASFLNGKQHGWSRSFYPDGKILDERSYIENKCYGRHTGWWPNGNKKFEFIYREDKKDGEFRQWYKSGSSYTSLHFKNDVEDGMQQAWRENGKLFINYEAREGYIYGLRKSVLCYTLVKESLVKR